MATAGGAHGQTLANLIIFKALNGIHLESNFCNNALDLHAENFVIVVVQVHAAVLPMGEGSGPSFTGSSQLLGMNLVPYTKSCLICQVFLQVQCLWLDLYCEYV